MTHTENTIWNSFARRQKIQRRYHPRCTRAANVRATQRKSVNVTSSNENRSQYEQPGRPPDLPGGKMGLARWQAVPVYKWCWVTLAKQSMVTCRGCRSC